MRPMSERPVLAVGCAIRFLTSQDSRVRGDSHDEVPMEPTMHGRLATAMTTTVSRRHGTPDGDDGDNEPMCSLELDSSCSCLDAACGSHALAESEPLITTALAMLPPLRPTVARAGCAAEVRSNNEQIARYLDGPPSLVPFFAFATDIFPKLQANISERANLLHFAKLAPTFSYHARPKSRRFVSCLVSATAPLHFSLRLRLLRAAWASSVTSSLSTTTQFSASRSVASSVYPHSTSSLLNALPLLVLLAISRFKLCGVRSRRRVLTCPMMRGPLLLLTIWLDAAEMLRSTPLTRG
jgi:hypothetical protein